MVNGVPLGQMPAKQVLRHEYVLEDIRPTGGSRMAWNAQHHVPALCLVRPPFQFPFACPPTSLQPPQVSDDAELPQRSMVSLRECSKTQVRALPGCTSRGRPDRLRKVDQQRR